MKTITVELAHPVMYANGSGDEVPGSHLEITAPTGEVAGLIGIFKSEIGRAQKDAMKGLDLDAALIKEKEKEKGAETENTPEEQGDALFQILAMGGADMPKLFITLKEVLRQTAQIGGEKSFKEAMFKRMDYNDIERTLKAYLGNFVQASE